MPVAYEINPNNGPQPRYVLRLFEYAGLSKPGWTEARMAKSIAGSASIICAWSGDELVGFASAISDGAWIAYLSQLAVKPDYQRKGIGKNLVNKIMADLGDELTVVVHSSIAASDFYQSVGFVPYSNTFVRKRKL